MGFSINSGLYMLTQEKLDKQGHTPLPPVGYTQLAGKAQAPVLGGSRTAVVQ